MIYNRKKCVNLIITLMMMVSYALCADYCGNQNINVTETVIDSPVQQYEWLVSSSGDSSVVFVRTVNNSVWRSSDEGATWTDVTPQLTGSDTPQSPSQFSGVSDIIPTANNEKIYFLGYGGKLWLTEDSGETFSSISTDNSSPVFIQIIPHPVDPGTAAGIAMSSTCFTNTRKKPKCYQELWMTNDIGRTWNFLTTYINQFAWSYPTPSEGYDYSYYFTNYTDTSKDQEDQTASTQQFVWSNIDNVQTILYDHVSGFSIFKNLVSVVQVNKKKANLYFSINGTNSQVSLPNSGKQSPSNYTILDSDADVIFVNVKYNNGKYGTTFVSDGKGQQFSGSLEATVRDEDTNVVNFVRVQGLNGIYIANQYPDTSNTASPISVATFDKGGKWQPLNNVTDAQGQPITCSTGSCSLHLQAATTKQWGTIERQSNQNIFYGPIYSTKNAIGLVLATGFVGTADPTSPSSFSTFLSTDAGWTWFDIIEGSNIYEMADHGALIAIMDGNSATNELVYSWNEGLTLQRCNISNNGSVEVDEIIAHPHSNSQTFTVFGSRTIDGSEKGVIFNVDFTSFHQRACNESDYYNWFPSSSIGSQCQLGKSVAYQRRLRTSECYNDKDFEPAQVEASCPCSIVDYECDYCFEMVSGVCEDVCDGNMTRPPDDCTGTYTVPSGYRLVAGDSCNITHPQAVDMLAPVTKQCPAVSTTTSTTTDNSTGTTDGATSATTGGSVTTTTDGNSTHPTPSPSTTATATTGGVTTGGNSTSSDDNNSTATTTDFATVTTTTGEDGNATETGGATTTGRKSGGMSGGAVAGIVLAIIIVAGFMTFISSHKGRQWMSNKWNRMRGGRAYQRPMDHDDDPELQAGGLSDEDEDQHL